jgi:uncharacterized membrane protein
VKAYSQDTAGNTVFYMFNKAGGVQYTPWFGNIGLGYLTGTFTYATGSKANVYVNGVSGSPASSSQASNLLNMNTTAYIGAYSANDHMFNGPIQRLIVYPSALSDFGITTVTNAVKDGP